MSNENLDELLAKRDELRRQQEELEKQLAEIRRNERRGIITQVKNTIQEYSITPAELGFHGVAIPQRPAGRGRRTGMRPEPTIAYRDPEGRTWSGGRGRRPQWVLDLQARGIDIEQYRVN
jgi:DNA-binding protein H-NS